MLCEVCSDDANSMGGNISYAMSLVVTYLKISDVTYQCFEKSLYQTSSLCSKIWSILMTSQVFWPIEEYTAGEIVTIFLSKQDLNPLWHIPS